MTTIIRRHYSPGFIAWAFHHNLDVPDEETGYIFCTLLGVEFGVLWGRL
jgi:hypothetical protein